MCQAVWSLWKPRIVLRSCGTLDLVWMSFSPCQAFFTALHSVANRPGPQKRSLVLGPEPHTARGTGLLKEKIQKYQYKLSWEPWKSLKFMLH